MSTTEYKPSLASLFSTIARSVPPLWCYCQGCEQERELEYKMELGGFQIWVCLICGWQTAFIPE